MSIALSQRSAWHRFFSFINDRSGGALLIFALALPAVVGSLGLGVEVGLWHLVRRQAQTAADAAALAAASQVGKGRLNQIASAAAADAARNGFAVSGDTSVSAVMLATAPGSPQQVEVIVSRREPLLFSRLFLTSDTVVTARAVATVVPTGTACVLALDPYAMGALTTLGNADVTLDGCMLAANSNNYAAIEIGGRVGVRAEGLWTAGDVRTFGASRLDLQTEPVTGAWILPDPYAGVTVPTYTNCSALNMSGKLDWKPGVYCGPVKFTGKRTVTMSPGVYVVMNGDFEVSGSGVEISCPTCVDGKGVTIILSGSTAYSIGNFSIHGGTINLSAPSTQGDPYRGILLMQDRRAARGERSVINGSADIVLNGAIYLPAQEVRFTGNMDAASTGCVQIVALRVTMMGTSSLSSEGCTQAGVAPVEIAAARLVQ